MKRLLTYGLLLLTILASHFVVSACQDDLPETTDIMVTFTTRAISGGTASTAPEIEQMHDLSVIMLRSDGTIVGMDDYKPEDENLDFNPSSVKFTFSTTIPNPEGEDFTFFAIANDETLPWEDLSVGQTLSESTITALKESTVDTDIDSKPIPQTDYWTVHVPQSNYKIDDRTLQFAGSKISVVFNNMTKEEQSLSNIRITGITPNTQGYLFKQDGTDYIDSKDNNATPISFDDLTLDAPTTVDDETIYASDSVAYYTYPLGEGNISSPMLYADWNGEQRELSLNKIKDKEGNEIDFTSLSRNEHLRIEITLTPAGDITVNYTIAAWEDTPTNIGDEAPITPGNGYNTENWGASNDIEIGGGGNDIWDLGNGTTIKGEEVSGATLVEIQRGGRWDLTEHLKPAENYIRAGYTLVIYFEPHFYYEDQPEEGDVNIQFMSGWDSDIGDVKTSYPRKRGASYVKYLEFKDTMNGINIDGENGLQTQNLSVHITSDIDSGDAIYIVKFAIIKPILTANP